MDAEFKKAGDLVSMLSKILTDCPEDPYIRMKTAQVIDLQEWLHNQEKEVLGLIEEFQAQCPHEKMLEVRKFDFDYRARVNDISIGGLNILLGHKCPVCKIFKPRKDGPPSKVCYKCGGDMKYVGRALYGMDDVCLHKCTVCGHEYGTM